MDAAEGRVANRGCTGRCVFFALDSFEGTEGLSVRSDHTRILRTRVVIVACHALFATDVAVTAQWVRCVDAGLVYARIDRAWFAIVAFFVAETALGVERCGACVGSPVARVDR